MGGGHHHHHGPPYSIPDHKIYKVDKDTPELLEVQNLLKSRGLKDPWLRNEVWRYDRKIYGPDKGTRWKKFFWRRCGTGLALAVATVGLEFAYDTYFGDAHGHGHGDHH